MALVPKDTAEVAENNDAAKKKGRTLGGQLGTIGAREVSRIISEAA
jgi:hypothetical protein